MEYKCKIMKIILNVVLFYKFLKYFSFELIFVLFMIYCYQFYGLMIFIDICNNNFIVFNKVVYVLMFIIFKLNKLVLVYVV